MISMILAKQLFVLFQLIVRLLPGRVQLLLLDFIDTGIDVNYDEVELPLKEEDWTKRRRRRRRRRRLAPPLRWLSRFVRMESVLIFLSSIMCLASLEVEC